MEHPLGRLECYPAAPFPPPSKLCSAGRVIGFQMKFYRQGQVIAEALT